MISPTGSGVRMDSEGSGFYGAKRGDRKHLGTDFGAISGQDIVAPFDNFTITREARPSSKHRRLSGISWKTSHATGQMFYFKPDESLFGKTVNKGHVIGIAQDLKPFYGDKMDSHIHFEIESFDPYVLILLSKILHNPISDLFEILERI